MIMGFRDLNEQIFNSKKDFPATALEIFRHQYHNNAVYHEWVNYLGVSAADVSSLNNIPFLPAEFFRNHKVITGDMPAEMIFTSSGTTGVMQAKHFVTDIKLYEESFMRAFRLFYGNPEEYFIAALLPSYTEREGSSLVYMTDFLIKKSRHPDSGFYRNNYEELLFRIEKAKKGMTKILLLGVSFALLDMAEKYPSDLSGVTIMETGGMKGRRKELIREELHMLLKEKLNISAVHSEYGMTELLSQAYSREAGIYYSPSWMKVVIRDPLDPLFVYDRPSGTGGINIIDLANINSCSFIATADLGKLHADGGFEILGRFDNSDIRGCNLLIE